MNSKCSQFECNDCAEGEYLIKKNTPTEYQNLDITTQWEISIDIRLDDITSTWGSVFHVTKSGSNSGALGNRSPSFFIKPEKEMLYRKTKNVGLGLTNIQQKMEAKLINGFLQTAINPKYLKSKFH